MMKPTVRYDAKADSLTIDSGEDVRIAVSSSVEDCLVGDFGGDSETDVVGIELLAAGKLLAQYCAATEVDANNSMQVASAMAPLKVEYDKGRDVLTVSTGRSVELLSVVGPGLIAHLGFEKKSSFKKYSVVGFVLHDASEFLSPWFELNRTPLAASGRDSD